jgi:hypothetical protein
MLGKGFSAVDLGIKQHMIRCYYRTTRITSGLNFTLLFGTMKGQHLTAFLKKARWAEIK